MTWRIPDTRLGPGPVRLAYTVTHAHLRACLGGLGLALGAVVLHRPDLLVLAAPLLAVAGWATLTRPVGDPTARCRLAPTALREGEAATWHVELDPAQGAEQAGASLTGHPWLRRRPESGVVCARVPSTRTPSRRTPSAGAPDPVLLRVAVRSTHWGQVEVGPGMVWVSGAWAAFRAGPVTLPSPPLTTLPLPATGDRFAPSPHPSGLVGVHRSRRPGEGTEFAGIRPFAVGDRLRRIHWPTSLRSGELHVSTSYADQDAEVVLLVDALNDVGRSSGVDGAASSLDLSVRAAAALAEHQLRLGDRVGLRVLGSAESPRLPARAGSGQLRRLLQALASIRVATDRTEDQRYAQLGLPAETLVVVLSPLLSPLLMQHAVTLARRGLAVVVVDTVPPGLVEPDRDEPERDEPYDALAWRIRLLERRRDVQRLERTGIPVVPWRGPGSLDHVLRDMARRRPVARPVRA